MPKPAPPPRRDPPPEPFTLRRITFFLVLLCVVLIPVIAFARAGGGEGFSGGGHSGGGDGNGDGSGIIALLEILYFLIRLCVEMPVVGIPLTIFAIVVFILVVRESGKQYQNVVITRGGRADLSNSQTAAIAALRGADPAFDPDAFTARASAAFLRLQQAWCAQNLDAVRPYASDGIVERFGLQFQEQRDAGYRNQMDDIQVLSATLADADASDVFTSATVRIHASAADYHVRIQDGQYVSGDRTPTDFVEYWTFLRRTGGTAPAAGKPGLLEGHCPNCGAAIAPGGDAAASAKCRFCGALLRNGQHDWVLAVITQESALRDSSNNDLSSIAAYRAASDPGFSPEHMEDRASVIFWRWAKSQRLGKIDPLAKVATTEFRDQIASALKPAPAAPANAKRTYIGRCAIGSVQALGVASAPDWDRAAVRVEWCGSHLSAGMSDAQSAAVAAADQAAGGRYAVSLMSLVRKHGVKSDPGMGLSSAHCLTCGAPQTDELADACPYCGAVLNDGSADWLVENILPINSNEARQIISALRITGAASPAAGPELLVAPVNADIVLKPDNVAAMLAWLAQVILADGQITDEELSLFETLCTNAGLPGRQAQAILAAAKSPTTAPTFKPSVHEARAWMEQLAVAIAQRGKIPYEDRQILALAAQKLGLTEWDATNIGNFVRAKAYKDAREALRQRKNLAA